MTGQKWTAPPDVMAVDPYSGRMYKTIKDKDGKVTGLGEEIKGVNPNIIEQVLNLVPGYRAVRSAYMKKMYGGPYREYDTSTFWNPQFEMYRGQLQDLPGGFKTSPELAFLGIVLTETMPPEPTRGKVMALRRAMQYQAGEQPKPKYDLGNLHYPWRTP